MDLEFMIFCYSIRYLWKKIDFNQVVYILLIINMKLAIFDI